MATDGNANNVRIWDIPSDGETYSENKAPDEYQEETVLNLAYSPDGKYLAGCVKGVSFGHAFLRDTATQQDIAIITGTNTALFCGSVAFHPNDNTIAFGENDGSIRIWNVDDLVTLREINVDDVPRILRGHTELVTSLAFNHVGSELVSSSADKTGRVWNYATGEIVTILNGHMASVWSTAFNPADNTIATGGEDGTLRLWDIQKQTSIVLDTTLIKDAVYSPSTISSVKFNSDGSILAESRLNGDINLWDVKNMSKLASVNGGHAILHIAFNLTGTILVSTSSNDTSVMLWGVARK